MSTLEHETFAKLTDALSRAESAALEIAGLRCDQQNGWMQIGKLILEMKDKVLNLALRGVH